MSGSPEPLKGSSAAVAVLTGDFVASTKHPPETLDAAFGVLNAACRDLALWHQADLRLTRFRGDGWQAVLARPRLSFRSVLFLQARVLAAQTALPTRIAVGTGNLSRPGSDSLADADGTALRAAGRALDTMGRNRRLDIGGDAAGPGEKAAYALADALSRRWSIAQAEALCDALIPDGPTQLEIAEKLEITQQSVSDRLEASGYWAIRDALFLLESTG